MKIASVVIAVMVVFSMFLCITTVWADNQAVPKKGACCDREGHYIPGHPRVNQVNERRENQHDRIQQGIKNGTINKQEATQLRQEGKAIHQEEINMRRADGGHLTPADQKALNEQQNQRSKEIYQDKHN